MYINTIFVTLAQNILFVSGNGECFIYNILFEKSITGVECSIGHCTNISLLLLKAKLRSACLYLATALHLYVGQN